MKSTTRAVAAVCLATIASVIPIVAVPAGAATSQSRVGGPATTHCGGTCGSTFAVLAAEQEAHNARIYTGNLKVFFTATAGVTGCIVSIVGTGIATALTEGAAAVVAIDGATFLGQCGVGAWLGDLAHWLS